MMWMRFALVGGALAALVGLYAFIYNSGYRAGLAEGKAEAANFAIEKREVQNEIRNRRPDDNALLERMRQGRF
jgi:hypothetical protein